jgi:hypothetical protein
MSGLAASAPPADPITAIRATNTVTMDMDLLYLLIFPFLPFLKVETPSTCKNISSAVYQANSSWPLRWLNRKDTVTCVAPDSLAGSILQVDLNFAFRLGLCPNRWNRPGYASLELGYP